MKAYSKLFLALAIMIFATLISGCKSKLTATASGQVTGVALDRDTKRTKTKTGSGKTKTKTKTTTETDISYVYTVAGQIYNGHAEKKGDVRSKFPVGASVVVCYNPAKPHDSDAFPLGKKCGG